MANEYETRAADVAALTSTPQWDVWRSQGRAPDLSQNRVVEVRAYEQKLKDEDKRTANLYELTTGQKATPDVIGKYSQYAHDPAMLQAAIGKEAALASAQGKFTDVINATIQDKLGRAATTAELEYFGKQMETGGTDAYGLQEFLGGTQEYQTKFADTARTKLASELSGADTEYLGKVEKGLQSRYAQAGRRGSSAFGSALIGAGKDLAAQRTGYLADIGYQSALGGQENLKAAYQNRLAQMYGQQQANAGLYSEGRQRYYSQQDFTRNQAAQERLARLSQPRQGSFIQGLLPGVIQAGATLGAAALTGPAGAAAAYNLSAPRDNYVMR